MSRLPTRLWIAGAVVIGACFVAAAAGAQPFSCNCGDITSCCPDLGQVQLTFARTFSGSYRHGEPYDVLTITPRGGLETWEQAGIRLRVQIVCSCNGLPIAGIPAQEMVLFNSSGCWCPGGNIASQDTDADGWTEFTGMMRGGGCGQSLSLFADGVAITTLPIKFNSPDTGAASACGVDQSDLAALATALGQPAQYSICYDYNESGIVDSSDLAYFAAVLGTQCQ